MTRPFSPNFEGSGGTHRPKAGGGGQGPSTIVDGGGGASEESGDRQAFGREVLETFYLRILSTIVFIVIAVFEDAASTAIDSLYGNIDKKGYFFEDGYIFSRFMEIWIFLFIKSNQMKYWPNDLYLFCTYIMAIICTGFVSHVGAKLCCGIKIYHFFLVILAAGITTGIFTSVRTLCLWERIDNTKWWLIQLVVAVVVSISGLIALILYGMGFLTNWHVIASLALSLFIVFLLFDLHKLLGIGWFKDRELPRDFRLVLSLQRDVFYIFTILFLIKHDPNRANLK